MTEKEKRIKELVVFAFKMINDYKQCDFFKKWVDSAVEDGSYRELMATYLASEAVDFEETGLIPKVPEQQDFILKAAKSMLGRAG